MERASELRRVAGSHPVAAIPGRSEAHGRVMSAGSGDDRDQTRSERQDTAPCQEAHRDDRAVDDEPQGTDEAEQDLPVTTLAPNRFHPAPPVDSSEFAHEVQTGGGTRPPCPVISLVRRGLGVALSP